jgi:hypothetical protein
MVIEMDEAFKDQVILQLIEMIDSAKKLEEQMNLIDELENPKPLADKPIALSQMRLNTEKTAHYPNHPNNFPNLKPQTIANLENAADMAIKLGKKELLFR